MRFFIDDGPDADDAFAAYERHLATIRPRLPATVRLLAGDVNLHDARIRRVILDRAGRELRLELRCGDREAGWYDLDLTYLGVVLDSADAHVLAAAARDPATEILHDEIDLGGGHTFLHRLLFHPHREGEILFRTLALRLVPRADRGVPYFDERFVELAAP